MPNEVTAKIVTPSIYSFGSQGLVAIGRVYGDTKGRFFDGEEIRTSLIKNIDKDKLVTLNSVYQVVDREDVENLVQVSMGLGNVQTGEAPKLTS